jgi:hypothetical protein
MAWTNSKIFSAFVTDVMNNTTAMDLNADTFKASLFDNDVTPSQTAASASTAYNTGAWAIAGNEVSDGAEWPATGEPLTAVTSTFSSNVYTFDATNTPSDGSSATLAAVFGCLVYDDTIAAPVADQGVCYNYFGGTNSVTDGTFTIIWNASGIFTLTL